MPTKYRRMTTGLICVLLLLPILAGLVGTLLPAFHYFPPLGETKFSFAAWQNLFSNTEFFASLKLTLITGILASIIALWLALALLAWGYES